MCGLNGILHINSLKKVDERILTKMRDSLEHRGPDSKGIYIDNNIGLGHRRLSILDTTDAGHQPFLSEDKRYALVYNGEIYNFKDFYPELSSNGFHKKTNSDTEVLMQLYQLYGLKMLNRLNGMFAFAIWDSLEKKLVVARDRMGVKPLYYSFFNDSFYFASEQKALFTAGVPLKIAQDGIEEYVFNRFVAGENTLYQNIQKLLPGHVLTIEASGKRTSEKWWDLKSEIQNHSKIENPVDWFRKTFDDSIRLRMVSDVPVGVLLSGGLDSASVLASMKEQRFENIETFNIGFKEAEHDEAHLAKLMADRCNYKFNTTKLEGDDLYKKMVDATFFQDEPIVHFSEPHILTLAELAKPKVKVLLSGEGADELMGGYYRYKALKFPSALDALNVFSDMSFLTKKPIIDKLLRYSKITSQEGLVIYNGSNIFPKDIENVFGIKNEPKNEYRYQILKEAKELYPNSLQRQALYFDQHTYLCSLLDRNDRCTMGASIECREPFLDPRLIIGIGTLEDKWLFTGKKGKYIQKKAMQNRLPKEILNFKKVGLSAPWGDYLTETEAFKDELSLFSKSDIFKMSIFENIKIENLVQKLQKGDSTIAQYIMPLFMMHIWMTNYKTKFS